MFYDLIYNVIIPALESCCNNLISRLLRQQPAEHFYDLAAAFLCRCNSTHWPLLPLRHSPVKNETLAAPYVHKYMQHFAPTLSFVTSLIDTCSDAKEFVPESCRLVTDFYCLKSFYACFCTQVLLPTS